MRRATGERDARRRGRGLVSLGVTLALLSGASGTGSCCDGTSAIVAGEAAGVTASTATGLFLGPDDFEGDFEPRDGDAAWGGEAVYLGRVVFLHLTRAEVVKMLPNDLQLAAKKSTSQPDLHPVILLFGRQTQTKLVYPFWTPEAGDDYNELILLVPFVQRLNQQRWHNYVVRMYLDDDLAIQLGNDYYGLRKQKAAFEETDTRFSVTRDLIERFAFQPTETGAWMSDPDAEATLDNYPEMKQIAAMPVIGRPSWADYICSYFEWDFEGAQVRSISGTSEFLQPFDTGMDSWVALGPIANVTDGAWQLEEFRWRIAFPPFPCEF
jgi:hypothetical protein